MKRSDLIQVIEAAQLAAQLVLDNWEGSGLAEAVRNLQSVMDEDINPAIAWWESDDA